MLIPALVVGSGSVFRQKVVNSLRKYCVCITLLSFWWIFYFWQNVWTLKSYITRFFLHLNKCVPVWNSLNWFKAIWDVLNHIKLIQEPRGSSQGLEKKFTYSELIRSLKKNYLELFVAIWSNLEPFSDIWSH